MGEIEFSTPLYYEGKEILRTTDTGIKINWEVAKWRIALAYIKYRYYKLIGRV